MRNKVVDVGKGVLIMLMVIGHSGSPFTNVIYSFHMVSFLFFSGFVYRHEANMKTFVMKKMLHGLYLPYVKVCLFFYLLTPLLVYLGIISHKVSSSIPVDLTNILLMGGTNNELIGPMWFIVLLFVITLVYYLLNLFVRHPIFLHFAVVICFIVGFSLVVLAVILPRYIGTAFVTILFFHIGKCSSSNMKNVNPFLAVCSMIFLFFTSHTVFINIGLGNFGNPILFLMMSICGIIVVLYVSQQIVKFKLDRYISLIGRKSYVILIWHLFFFKIVTLCLVYLFDLPHSMWTSFPVLDNIEGSLWFFYFLCGVLGPLLISKIYNYLLKTIGGFYDVI